MIEFFCPLAGFSQSNAEQHCPCQDAEIICIGKGVYRIGDDAHQKAVKNFADPAGSSYFGGCFRQSDRDREQETCGNCHTSGKKCAKQIKKDDPFHITLFAFSLMG